MVEPTDCQFKLRIFYSVLGIFIGLSAFCVFAINYYNWNVACWGLLSVVPAAVTLIIHIRYRHGAWEIYPERLKFYMLVGCFTQLLGICGFVTYLVLAIVLKQGLVVYGTGYFLTCVWCFMVWKWGFFLFLYSRSYRRIYGNIYTVLPKEDINSYGR